MKRALALFAAFGLAVACATKSVGPTISAAPVEPVYFQSGSVEFVSDMDLLSIGQAVDRIQADSNVYLLLVGYADSTGDAATNQALSLERARRIRLLIAERSGVDPNRILLTAMGEENTSGDLAASRRVEFIFYVAGEEELNPSVESILAAASAAAEDAAADAKSSRRDDGDTGMEDGGDDTGDASSDASSDDGGSKKSKKSKSKDSSSERELLNIEPTGIAEFDAFFSQVQPLLDTLRSATARIDEANTNLNAVMGLAADADPSEALSQLAAAAAGSVKVTMDGVKPNLTFEPTAPAQVQQGVQAVNGLVTAMAGAVTDLAQIPSQAQVLVAEAKALPAKVPEAVKSAGLSMGEMGTVAKATKNNVKVVTSIPVEATDVVTSAKDTMQMVASAFK